MLVITVLLLLVLSSSPRSLATSLTFSNGTVVPLWDEARDTGHSMRCKHSRASMAQAALTKLDSDGDGCIDLIEMQAAFSACLSWVESVGMRLGSFFGSVQTPESTMERCDRTGDKRMCLHDLLITQKECEQYSVADLRAGHMNKTCMCDCSSIDQLYQFILSREPC